MSGNAGRPQQGRASGAPTLAADTPRRGDAPLEAPKAALQAVGRGDDTDGNPDRAQISQFELFELVLLWNLHTQTAPCRAVRGSSISVNSTPICIYIYVYLSLSLYIYIYIYVSPPLLSSASRALAATLLRGAMAALRFVTGPIPLPSETGNKYISNLFKPKQKVTIGDQGRGIPPDYEPLARKSRRAEGVEGGARVREALRVT